MDGTRARVLLGVSELATVDDVRRAFRRRAQAVHPDHGGDPRQFGEVRSALDTLLAVVPTAPPARVYGPVDVYDVTPPVRAGSDRTGRAERPSFADSLRLACAQWSSGN